MSDPTKPALPGDDAWDETQLPEVPEFEKVHEFESVGAIVYRTLDKKYEILLMKDELNVFVFRGDVPPNLDEEGVPIPLKSIHLEALPEDEEEYVRDLVKELEEEHD